METVNKSDKWKKGIRTVNDNSYGRYWPHKYTVMVRSTHPAGAWVQVKVISLQYFTKTVCLYKLSEEGDRKIPEVSSVLHLAVTVF